MDNKKLKEYDTAMTKILSQEFGFEPHEHTIYDARDPASNDILEGVGSQLMTPEQWREINGSSEFLNTDGADEKYIAIISSEIDDAYIYHMGGRIVLGEHAALHTNPQLRGLYRTDFQRPYRAMLTEYANRLGFDKYTGEDFNVDVELNCMSEPMMLASLGRIIGKDLYYNERFSSSKELFMAKNQADGWKIIQKDSSLIMSIDIADVPVNMRGTLLKAIGDMGFPLFGITIEDPDQPPKYPVEFYEPKDN
jgi:hypothetical protein